MIKSDVKEYQCPLCGYRFNKDEAEQACTACPLKSNCEVICCPHCRYQFIIESKVLSWVSKFKERKASPMKTNQETSENNGKSPSDFKGLYSEHRFEHRIDHGLCLIWNELEKNNHKASLIKKALDEAIDTRVYEELARSGLIADEENFLNFTETGKSIAADIVRRRRLAERLFEDVLEIPKGEIEYRANEFEHLIDRHVEESICILLGHPRECPHGFPIPPGKCCADKEDQLESIVASLDHFESGESGRVAYIITRNHPQLHKLMSLGIVPGTLIHVHQTYPSFIIKVEETQLALEQKVAENIYLRRL